MKYAIGLDIGTASCGWSVVNLDKNRIEELGVRIFERPENPKNGQSLALPRRAARSARKRIRRRRQRLHYLKNFFVKNGLLTGDQISHLYENKQLDPYALREKGQAEALSNEELYVALRHIAKRRGYKSNRKSTEEGDSDAKKVLSAISDNKQYLAEYGSIATALNHADKFASHKRNKANSYINSFIREDFQAEIESLLKTQQQYHPKLTNEKINELLFLENYGLFYQRPFMTTDLINKMRGKCQFTGQPRGQKASCTFELFRLAEELAHVTFNHGERLVNEQIALCIEKAKSTASGLKYSHIREIVGAKNDDNFHFDYMRGKLYDKDKKEIPELEREKTVFVKMPFYHAVKKALKDCPEDWARLSNDIDLFDSIGFTLTANKDDDKLETALRELNLPDTVVDAVMRIPDNFTGFAHLSLEALRKITPLLLEGNTYDKAVVAAGYNFKQRLSGDKNKLPPLNPDQQHEITNPVVKRAISQTIKVVNAIIAKYGAPSRICLECARDLAKNFSDRRKIEERQKENAENNAKLVERLQNEFKITSPNGLQITKFKLFLEQDSKCAYSGKKIVLDRLFSDESYCEIDHIIPFSRCGNDSLANKVLVLNSENQEKRNRTPYETWGQDASRWADFKARIESNPKLAYKKKRLFAETLPKEDWGSRALNDTRYISRFMTKFIRENLRFADDGKGAQKVFTPNGGITHFLRSQWHIGNKNREEDNLHHAVDATIIALTTQSKIKECAEINKWQNLGMHSKRSKGILITDEETGEQISSAEYRRRLNEILPWPEFDKELLLRVSQPKAGDTLAIWQDQFRDLYKDQDEEFRQSIHPIFVSRMPKRNGTGATNKDTIRSPKHILDPEKVSYIRKRLQDINLQALEKSSVKYDDKILYEQLKSLLEANDDDPKKAFAEPVYKGGKQTDKNGKPISPVSTIKVEDDKVRPSSGLLLNNNTQFVNNKSMIRLDIYSKLDKKGKKKHYVVPIYSFQVKEGSKRILQGKATIEKEQYVDNSYDFVASFYPNDYIMCYSQDGSKTDEGYYSTYDYANGGMELVKHTNSDKEKTVSLSPLKKHLIKRLNISVLGDNYPWE